MEAPILFRDGNAILKFDTSSATVFICGGADKTGKNRVLVQAPVSSVINVETSEERVARQQNRTKECHQAEQALRAAESSALGAAADDDEQVGCLAKGRSRRLPGRQTSTILTSGSVDEEPVHDAVVAPQLYFLHFINDKQRKLNSVMFYSRGGASELALVRSVVQAILAAVYVCGTKQMTAFVSPISGSGQAKVMWERDVLPVLFLSRHFVSQIVTERQAHCEDFVADLNNKLTRDHVVIAIGGDGMVHEAVNGLQRRREALRQGKVNEEEDGLPLLATIPAGSGCALAKCFNIIEPSEAAKALVHLNSTLMDLLHITYVPCMHTFVPTDEEIKHAKKNKRPPPQPKREMTHCSDPPRYAFLNCAFAITNEIDKGSEKWRWMGNARFTVKAMQLLASGIPLYRCKVRYLPWEHPLSGERVEKTCGVTSFEPKAFPRCTGRDGCSHCEVHRRKRSRDADDAERTREISPKAGTSHDERTIENWVSLKEDRFALLMLNNLVDAARDMAMAPLAHVGDGAIDIVYNGKRPEDDDGISRTDFIKVFMGLESGAHIKEPGIRYIKAREVEVLPEDGLVMADGELLPTSGVRVRVEPAAVRVVRSL